VPANYDKVMGAGQPSAQDKAKSSAQARPGAEPSGGGLRPSPSPWYFGGAVGRSGFDTDLISAKADVAATGATAFSVRGEGYDDLWKAYVGYWLSPRISLEGGLWTFGGPTYTADVTAPVTASFTRSFRVHGLGAHTVLWQPFGASWAGFGKIGVMRLSTRARPVDAANGLAGLPNEKETTWNAQWGLGMEYRISRHMSARLEYENVTDVGDDSRFGTADLHAVSFGFRYGF